MNQLRPPLSLFALLKLRCLLRAQQHATPFANAQRDQGVKAYHLPVDLNG